MTKHFYIGVDGGATKCTVRIEDAAGRLLGKETSGPASIRLSVDRTWESIYSALNKLLGAMGLSLQANDCHFHAGMGLAGCEIVDAYQAFNNRRHSFETLVVSSDSHVACLGAHSGKDGAIIIAGTGVVGYQIQAQQTAKVGGWGFPHDDEGGGAWLGLQAVKTAVQWLDGRAPSTALAEAVYHYFDQDPERLVTWANSANSTAFAELAPLVIQQSQQGDSASILLVQQAAAAINKIGSALFQVQATQNVLPCSLIGGMSNFIEPHLDANLRARLCPPQLTADAGAVLLVRRFLDCQGGV